MERSIWHSRFRQITRHVQAALGSSKADSHSAFASTSMKITSGIIAYFSPAARTLTVIGDERDNKIELSSDAAGAICINGGAVRVLGGTPIITNTRRIKVFGIGDNGSVSFNEANGALPRVAVTCRNDVSLNIGRAGSLVQLGAFDTIAPNSTNARG